MIALRALKRVLSLGGLNNRLSILIYHRVLPQPDPIFPEELDAAAFDRQLACLAECFNVIPLAEAVYGLRTGTLPPYSACITFDDGYADNAEIALPILQQHGMAATFFVASGFLDGGRMWNDTVIELIRAAPIRLDLSRLGHGELVLDNPAQRHTAIATLLRKLKYLPIEQRQAEVDALRAEVAAALPAELMMTSDQVRALHRAGMEIGGHTVNHPILARLDDVRARQEIGDGRDALEAIIGSPVRLFAFPNGRPGQDYRAEHVAMVRTFGFDAAVSTAEGAACGASDLYQLPRFTPWDTSEFRFSLRMMHNLQRSGKTV